MQHVYTFFFRLFFTFLAAKLLVFLADWHGLAPLLVITLGLMGNVYFFDYLTTAAALPGADTPPVPRRPHPPSPAPCPNRPLRPELTFPRPASALPPLTSSPQSTKKIFP